MRQLPAHCRPIRAAELLSMRGVYMGSKDPHRLAQHGQIAVLSARQSPPHLSLLIRRLSSLDDVDREAVARLVEALMRDPIDR